MANNNIYNIIYNNEKITYMRTVNKLESLYNNGKYNGNELFVLNKFIEILQNAINDEISTEEFVDHTNLINAINNFNTNDTTGIPEVIFVEDSPVNLDDLKNSLIETINSVSNKYGHKQNESLNNIKTKLEAEIVKEISDNNKFNNEERRLKEIIDNTENVDPAYQEKYESLTVKYKTNPILDSTKTNIIRILGKGEPTHDDTPVDPTYNSEYIIKVFEPLIMNLEKLIKDITNNYSEIISNVDDFEAYKIYSSYVNAFIDTWNEYNPEDDKIYSFISYGDAEGTTTYAEGKVETTGRTSETKAEVIVIENGIEDFVGKTFWVDKNASVGDSLYQLYNEQDEPQDIWVKLTNVEDSPKTKQQKLEEILTQSEEYQNANDNVKNIINDIINKNFDEGYKYSENDINTVLSNTNELNNTYAEVIANNEEKNNQIEQKKETLASLKEQYKNKYNKDYQGKDIDETPGEKSTADAISKIDNINEVLAKANVTGVELNVNQLVFNPEEGPKQLTVTILPENAGNVVSIEWTSSDTNVATVDENGNVTPVGAGETTIKVTVTTNIIGQEPFVAECSVNISEQIIPVESITLDESNIELTVNEEDKQLTATVLPENATNKNVIWTSENESIATVGENGLVHAVSAGETNIIVKSANDENITATCHILVNTGNVSVDGVTISHPEIIDSVNKNEEIQFTAIISPENATNKNVTWTSSDTNVATVNENGLVYTVGSGSTTITVTTEDGNFIDEYVLVVYIPVESIELSENSIELFTEDDKQLTATVSPEDASEKQLVWTSEDESIATVDENGLVHGVNAGETNIIVTNTHNDVTSTCNVTVKDPVLFYIGKDESVAWREVDPETGDTIGYDFDMTSPLIQKLESIDDIFTTWDLITSENKYIYMIADNSVNSFEVWDAAHDSDFNTMYTAKISKQYKGKTYNLYRSGLTSESSVIIERA